MATERGNCWDWPNQIKVTISFEREMGAKYKVFEIPSEMNRPFRKQEKHPYTVAFRTYRVLQEWLNDPARKGTYFLHVWGNPNDTLALIDCHMDDPDTAFEFKMRWC